MKHLGAAFIVVVFTLTSFSTAADNPGREFMMSCTYGVLAGTLVGAASLAFVDKPGQNLNRVARGASFGLYAGILLGIYVVYIVPGQDRRDEEGPSALIDPPRFDMAPTAGLRGQVDGLQAQFRLTSF